MSLLDDVKVVLFDYDDTLVGTMRPKWAQHKHIARNYYGKDLTDDDIRPHWGKPFQQMICLLYGTDDVEQAVAYNQTHRDEYPKVLFVETVSTLQHLRRLGKKTGIITATIRRNLEQDLALHDMSLGLFDYIQTSDETDRHKPDPRVFDPVHEWLKREDIKPDEVLYVGDGLHDMKAALGAGFAFLGVETGLVTAAQFKQAGATSVSSLKGLVS